MLVRHPVFNARVKRFSFEKSHHGCPHLRFWWSQKIPPKLEPELPKKTVSNAWHWVNIPSIIPTKFVGKICLDHHPFSNNNRYIYIYKYMYTWNPNVPCFNWKRPSFRGKTKDKWLPAIYIYIIRFQEFSKNTFDPIVVNISFFRRLTSRRSTSLL